MHVTPMRFVDSGESSERTNELPSLCDPLVGLRNWLAESGAMSTSAAVVLPAMPSARDTGTSGADDADRSTSTYEPVNPVGRLAKNALAWPSTADDSESTNDAGGTAGLRAPLRIEVSRRDADTSSPMSNTDARLPDSILGGTQSGDQVAPQDRGVVALPAPMWDLGHSPRRHRVFKSRA